MRPVKTEACDVVYRGNGADVGDLHCQRVQPGVIRAFYKPNEAELEALALGGGLALDICTEPIPPVALNVLIADDLGEVEDHPFFIPEAHEERGG